MESVLQHAEKFVVDLLTNKLDNNYVYHNLSHTQRVVEKTNEFIEALKIEGESAENLLVASWFHDVGYTKGKENHEEESIRVLLIF